ncbi:MAG: hypothetical protein U1E51_30970 [Candidatus Binatia bacterium]|nr:hypothetical protein [Candidatus Binatia bacterium]
MALINSNSIKGKQADNGETKLYDLGNGCFIKLTEKQARERGLVKMQEPVKNKMRQPAKNKGAS